MTSKQKLLKGAWVYSLIMTICLGLLIIPLCWMIPMNVVIYKAYKNNQKLSIPFTICYSIFCMDPMVVPFVALAVMDKKERHQYLFIWGVVDCILLGSGLIPLIWMIPLTINMYKAAKEDQPVGVYSKFFWFLLVNAAQGAMLLFEDNLD